MNNLKICGSSFLLPKNKGWKPLDNQFNLTYSEYGDISGSLFNTDANDSALAVIFYEDIISNSQIDIDLLEKKFFHLFKSISHRSDKSNKPTIICWASSSDMDVIRMAKENSAYELTYSWFTQQLRSLQKNYPSLYFLNFNNVLSKFGNEQAFDDRNWYFARCRLSSFGIFNLATAANSVLARHFKPASKVLILDCDNTIWGGVIGEDGIKGILLGQDGIGCAFVDFQKEVKNLINDGVIVALASKNNEADVWNVFNNHPAMILKKSDIVSWRINWAEKSENIKSIADELDLNIDSFVFWDDNPIERDKVKNIIPQVNTIDMPDDVLKWPRLIKNLEHFAKFEITKDDRRKTSQYHGRAKFVRDSTGSNDVFEYLKGINLQPIATNLNDALLGRAVQLCSKTNQFNLRTIRHTASELLELHKANNDFCFLINLTDIYGDHGVVALTCLKKLDDELLFIDTLLMSCRVLGRHLEAWILNEIVVRAKKYKFKYLVGEFITSGKNVVSKDFFNNHGFSPIHNNPDLNERIIKSNATNRGDIFLFCLSTSTVPYMDIYANSKHSKN